MKQLLSSRRQHVPPQEESNTYRISKTKKSTVLDAKRAADKLHAAGKNDLDHMPSTERTVVLKSSRSFMHVKWNTSQNSWQTALVLDEMFKLPECNQKVAGAGISLLDDQQFHEI